MNAFHELMEIKQNPIGPEDDDDSFDIHTANMQPSWR